MRIRSLFAICMLALFATGCTTVYKQGYVVTVKQRVFGVVVETASTQTAMPNVKLGLVTSVIHLVPTSTNTIYAPKYVDSFELQHSLNPFGLGVSEDASFGDVTLFSTATNTFNAAIVPTNVTVYPVH